MYFSLFFFFVSISITIHLLFRLFCVTACEYVLVGAVGIDLLKPEMQLVGEGILFVCLGLHVFQLLGTHS